jgi:hypothetical protein
MTNIEGAQPRSAPWAGPAALLAAVGAAGLWLGQAGGADLPVGLLAGLLALAAALGVVWLHGARTARRLFAALDAYVEQELTRAARQPRGPTVPRRSTAARAGV